jgi:para-aminobenzoate synthetase / 4-amino-4-deoxychorismate lyase
VIARFDSASPSSTGWDLRFSRPRAVYAAQTPEQVLDVLRTVERETARGAWAVVVLAYEAAGAFDAAYRFRGRPLSPLAWAAISDAPDAPAPAGDDEPTAWGASQPAPFTPALDRQAFVTSVASVQAHIAAGDTYQVNLTFPLHGRAPDDALGWYSQLRGVQQAGYCAWLDLGDHVVVSLSPELFFERRGTLLRTKPMKGTAPRGRWLQEDETVERTLSTSPKARAENVMIVDLLRNDLGRVATTGSVRVPHLFTAERYPTLWQLTSTIEAHVPGERTLTEILTALFPCGSITGAPKISTMGLIAAHEVAPRGIYTGAIGFVRPGGDCSFSVAIRTIVIDRRTGEATLGVGAGITADSVGSDEYDECLLKAAFLTASAGGVRSSACGNAGGAFSLLETMRLSGGRAVRRTGHLARMTASAQYFGLPWRAGRVESCLDETCRAHPTGEWRLRLLVDARGAPSATCTLLDDASRPRRVALARTPVDGRDPFLCNKTTCRGVYEAARAARPDVDDVILFNEGGELTESTIANLVLEIDGTAWTPPLACGLLGGVYRGELVGSGALRERRLTRADLARASGVWLVNSLRGRMDVSVVP